MRATARLTGPTVIVLTLAGRGGDETLALARLYDARHVHMVCKSLRRAGRGEAATATLTLAPSALRFRELPPSGAAAVVATRARAPARRRRG